MSKLAFLRHRHRWSVVVLVAVLSVGWLSGLPSWWIRQSVVSAIARRNYVSAWDRVKLASLLESNNPETEFLIARLERKRGNLDQVRQHLQRAAARGLDSDRVHREELLIRAQTGQLTEIISELDKLLINHSDDGAEICDAYANGLLINGQVTEAESLIQQWQQAFPDDPQPDYLLGRSAEFSGNMPGAESLYRKSLAKNGQYFVAANSLGRALGELGKWSEALKAYEACLAFHSPAPAKLEIARCLTNLGREEEALSLLRTLVEIPQANLNDSLMQLGEPIEIDALAFELGSLEAKYDRTETAVNLLNRAVEYNPKHREARYQLARALRAVGRVDEARKHFDWYQETQEKVAEINRILDKVKLDPRNLDLRCRLGTLYLDVGSQSAGVFWLRSVLAEEPTHLAAKEALSKHVGEMNLPARPL